MNCWQVLDNAYRSKELFGSLAPLGIKDIRTRQFSREVERIGPFRGLYHHFRRSLSTFPEKSPPIIGSLSWVDSRQPSRFFMVSLDSGSVNFSIPSLTFDTWQCNYVDDFVFHAGDKSISLENITKSCVGLSEALEEFLVFAT